MNNEEIKKEKTRFSGFVQKTMDVGKKAAQGAKSGVSTIVEKTKAAGYARRLKKFNPLFPDEFKSETFKLPNIIMIVDDAVRRDIDVCEGAIGWLGKEADVEVLYLYDEAIQLSGIQFVPAAVCDEVYCVDSFDRSRFIRTDCIFGKSHEERMAELKHIAYSLGAKRCTIEICEAYSDMHSQNSQRNYSEKSKKFSTSESFEHSVAQAGRAQRTGRIEAEFKGHSTPVRPELKWFAHDDTIKRLIEMCCDGKRSVKTETLELSGSSSATMSIKTARAIDATIGAMSSGNAAVSMDAKAQEEHNSKLFYYVEF